MWTRPRTGIRFSRGAGGYNNHNRHVFDGPNFELRQLDPNVAIPFLNETDGTAIIGRALRMAVALDPRMSGQIPSTKGSL